MMENNQPSQAENSAGTQPKADENTGANPVVTALTWLTVTIAAGVATLFGLHAVGANENKNQNRASGLFARFQRASGDHDGASRTEKNTALNNISTGAKVVGDKVGQCANKAATVVSACVEQVMPK